MRYIGAVLRRCSQGRDIWVPVLTIVAAGTATLASSATPPRFALQAASFAETLAATQVQPPDEIFLGDFEPPPPNDTCENATTLSVNGGTTFGTTHDATSNYNSGLETCTGFTQAGPDVAYAISLNSSQTITVTLSAPDAGFDPSISLLGPGPASVCNAVPVTCLAGADANYAGGGESFMYTTSQAGTYYIIVDSYDGSGGFTIGVTSP